MTVPIAEQEQTKEPEGQARAGAFLAQRVPVRLGLAPRTLDEGWRLSQLIAKSALVPKAFQGKPEDVLVAVQMGMELGLAPLQALASIAVINGRASVWGDGFLAIIMASSVYRDHDEYYLVKGQRHEGLVAEDFKHEDTAAVCTFWRHGKATPVTRRFTISQAKKAGLLGKEGPWQQYPDRMLSMRARGFAGRDAFSDVLRGIRTAEEAEDTPPEASVETEPMREVRRISETAPSAPAPMPGHTLGPIGVKSVSDALPLLGGYVLTLADGVTVQVANVADAQELEKFVGTSHAIRVLCDQVDGSFRLTQFSIAD